MRRCGSTRTSLPRSPALLCRWTPVTSCSRATTRIPSSSGRTRRTGEEDMAGRVEGKVALITGAARGQGRSHAVRLAEEGADIIAVDVCADVEVTPYPMSSEDDLAETVRQVEALDRRIVARVADVRDLAQMQAAVDDGVA